MPDATTTPVGSTTTATGAATAPSAPVPPGTSEDLRRLLDKPLSRMNTEDFEALARKDAAGAAKVCSALVRMNTAELPDTVFARRDGHVLKKIRCRVALKVGAHLTGWNAKGDEAEAQPAPTTGKGRGREQQPPARKKVYSINAAGYRFLNQYVGLQIVTPPEVVVNDKRQPNPFVEVDPKTSLPMRVYCRKLAIGPSQATGALVATDMMIRLDLNIYLVETLLSKLKWRDPDKPWMDEWGRVGGDDQKPTLGEGVVENWRFLPILSIGGLGVWINACHPYMVRILSEHMTRTKFIDRIVQTMTERNALKAHPSMPGTAGEVVNDRAMVDVVGWTRDWSQSELEEIGNLAQMNRLHEVADEVHTQQLDTSDLADEEGASMVDEAAGEQEETERAAGLAKDEPEEPGSVDITKLTAEAFSAMTKHKGVHGPKPTKDKLKELIGDKKLEEAGVDELKLVIKTFTL